LIHNEQIVALQVKSSLEGINLAATDLVLQVRGPRASSIDLSSVLQLKIWRSSSPTSSSVLQVKSSLEDINLATTDLVLQVRDPRGSSIGSSDCSAGED
jgi:hypothetical protein